MARKASGIFPLLLAMEVALAMAAGLTGCANPGPPLPPSLKLPTPLSANEITATRVGNTVALHWTTPTHTTDKLLIAGPITVVVCRSLPPAAPNRPAPAKSPCSEVARRIVTPGASDAVDPLPAELTAGPPRLLMYRVALLNAKGHSAGPSAPVFAAAGTAPAPLQEFRAAATKPGVLLRWQQQAGPGESIELTRTMLDSAAATSAAEHKQPNGLTASSKEPTESRFHAGPSDVGGTLDRTVQIGHTYAYSAQRVRTVQLGGQTVELRSATSPAVTVSVRDIFPPEVPTGLVAVPGYAGEGSAQRPAIDLSWDPDIEPRVAGYCLYRREGSSGVWQKLAAELVPVPAYRDAAVVAGHIYTYRITAVSTAGNESTPSSDVTETAPAR